MSGGVDSSTVAAMLRAEGHNVVGLTMQLWNQRRLAGHEGMPEQVQGRCCSIDDVYDARRVAEDLDIPYYVVNHEERFERDVVRPFIDEYLSGRTPIPCSLCNNHLKFDQLLITARQIGADMLATGHYARCEFSPERNRWLLRRAADPAKDQTYFLFGLTQEQLAHLAGLHPTYVSLLERGQRNPGFEIQVKLVGALGIDANDLYKGVAWTPPVVGREGRFRYGGSDS